MSCALAIDSSTQYCSLAVMLDGKITSTIGSGQNSHSEELPGLLADVCREAGVDRASISEIICGEGPGSFTGLRIGFAFAKGLAASLPASISLASSFDAVARSSGSEAAWVAVVADARRDEVFYATYERGSDKTYSRVVSPCLLPQSELGARYSEAQSKYRGIELLFAGGSFPLLLAGSGIVAREIRSLAPALFALPRSQTARTAVEVAGLAPNYIRRVAARTLSEQAELRQRKAEISARE